MLIGRPVTAHAFRGSLATLFGDAPVQLRRTLARTMNHSFEVHEQIYTQQKRRHVSQQALRQYMRQGHAQASTVAECNVLASGRRD